MSRIGWLYLLPNAVTLDGIDDSILVDFIEIAVLIRCPELALVTRHWQCNASNYPTSKLRLSTSYLLSSHILQPCGVPHGLSIIKHYCLLCPLNAS